MLISTHTMQALTERQRETKISKRKPAKRLDGDRTTGAPSTALAARPVAVG